ncbi:MAG: D-alanyl-D-alanine carboxypeptidase, partial [Bacteroidota bacterium]
MMRLFGALTVAAMIAGCTAAPMTVRPTDPLEALRYDIAELLADSLFRSTQTGILIVSPGHREVLFERNSRMLFRPASNMKLLTSSAALLLLGPSFGFHTVVSADSLDNLGTVWGNLTIRGSGNPDLTSADLDSLAVGLTRLGISKILGNIVADVS